MSNVYFKRHIIIGSKANKNLRYTEKNGGKNVCFGLREQE